MPWPANTINLDCVRALIASLQAELDRAQRDNAGLRQQLDVVSHRLFGEDSPKPGPRAQQLARAIPRTKGERLGEPR